MNIEYEFYKINGILMNTFWMYQIMRNPVFRITNWCMFCTSGQSYFRHVSYFTCNFKFESLFIFKNAPVFVHTHRIYQFTMVYTTKSDNCLMTCFEIPPLWHFRSNPLNKLNLCCLVCSHAWITLFPAES